MVSKPPRCSAFLRGFIQPGRAVGNWQRPFVPVAAIPVPRSLEDGSGYPHRLDRSMVSNNHGLTS